MSNVLINRILQDIFVSIMFLTVIPLKKYRRIEEKRHLSDAQWAFPVIQAIKSIAMIVVVTLSSKVGLSPLISASLGVLMLTIVSGFDAEKALAEFADNIGQNVKPPKPLEVLGFNPVGVKGCMSLILFLFLRIALIAELIEYEAFGLMILAASTIGVVTVTFTRRISIIADSETVENLIGPASDKNMVLSICLGALFFVPLGFFVLMIYFLMVVLGAYLLRALLSYFSNGTTRSGLSVGSVLLEIIMLAVLIIGGG